MIVVFYSLKVVLQAALQASLDAPSNSTFLHCVGVIMVAVLPTSGRLPLLRDTTITMYLSITDDQYFFIVFDSEIKVAPCMFAFVPKNVDMISSNDNRRWYLLRGSDG